MKNITQYIPHSGKMVLVDEIIEFKDKSIKTRVKITKDSMFITDKGIPSYVGIEYMAQSIAAYAGSLGKKKGDAPKIGFLLGSRNYKSSCAYFENGDILNIEVTEQYIDESGLALFDCEINWADNKITATLNVFHPEEIAEHF